MDWVIDDLMGIAAIVFLMGIGVVAFVGIVMAYLAVLDVMENIRD